MKSINRKWKVCCNEIKMTVVHTSRKEAGETEIAGSWGRFARRLNLSSGYCKEENRTNDSIWFYVAISALYFFLIGLVLLILLLAPKYKPVHHSHLDVSSASSMQETKLPPELPFADESEDYFSATESKHSIQDTPKDPLYDIDPRSPIFRGNPHEWQNEPNEGKTLEQQVSLRLKSLI